MMNMIESSDDNLSDEISLEEVYENEKSEEQRKITKERTKKYNSRPGVKERRTEERIIRNSMERLKKMDEDQHTICKKLGKSLGYSSRYPEYHYKCTKCEASYSDKEKSHFFKGNKCPCCHLMLRQRKTIAQKRKQYG